MFTGRNLRRICGRVSGLTDRLSRARYFRGHGVHSPFIYDIVRLVFMHTKLLPGDRALFTELTARGLSVRRAIQLQNLYIHCAYGSFGVNRVDDPEGRFVDFCVVTGDRPESEVREIVRTAASNGITLAVLTPYKGREQQEMCRRIVAKHRCTTVDNRGYLLLFNNYLPKQHFRI